MGILRKEDPYETPDINVAAVLCTLGVPLLDVNRTDPNRATFVFPDSQELRRALRTFWRKELRLDPQDVLAQLKFVKSRLYGDS